MGLLDLGIGLFDRLFGIYKDSKNMQLQQDTNATNLQIARELNDTNIKNTQATNDTILANGRATNDANIKIAQNTNSTNAAIAAADRQAQLDQWKRENAYNTPAMQAARFREAGLNPSLASGDNGNAGSLSLRSSDPAVMPTLANPASGITAPNASATATMVAPQMNMDLGLSDLYSRYLDNSMKAEQVESANIDNQIKRATQRSQIERLIDEAKKANNDAEVSRLESILKGLDIEIKRDTKDDVVGAARATRKREEQNANAAEQDVELRKLEVAAKQEENEFLSKYHGKQLAQAEQQIRQLKQTIRLAALAEGRESKRFEQELYKLKQDAKAAEHDKDYKRIAASIIATEFRRKYYPRYSYIDKNGKKHWQSAADVEDAVQNTPIGRLATALGLTGADILNAVKSAK